MAGRAFAFADPKIIELAKTKFVPVTADDWYQRRRQDEEGKFWMSIAQQGRPRDDGGTRQGIYCFTADGQLLAYKNAGNNPGLMRDMIRQGLRDWQRLPEARRRPGAVQVDDPATLDNRFARTPPPGGLIVTVYTRILERDQGAWRKGTCPTRGGDQAARDHLWLTEAEWKALVPADPHPGDRSPLPAPVAERILRFHLTDNTRGEPPMWRRDDIRRQRLTLTVEEATPGAVRLRLEGSALLARLSCAAPGQSGFS